MPFHDGTLPNPMPHALHLHSKIVEGKKKTESYGTVTAISDIIMFTTLQEFPQIPI